MTLSLKIQMSMRTGTYCTNEKPSLRAAANSLVLMLVKRSEQHHIIGFNAMRMSYLIESSRAIMALLARYHGRFPP